MFTKIYIDNLQGILNPIELDFIAQSRNKEESNTVIKTEDGMYINKLIGIMGGNASGKTSIISAIGILGQLLTAPILQFDIEEKISNIKDLLDKNKEDRELFRNIIDSINSSTDISVQNASRRNEDTKIEVEMYIVDDEQEYTGYYKYNIRFNGIEKKIKHEYFSFRNRYRGKEKVIIDIENSKESQLYYINRYYKNIKDFEENKYTDIENRYKYCNAFFKHYIINSSIIDTSQDCNYKELKYIDWFKKSPEFLRELVKIVDHRICDIVIDTDNRHEELLFVLEDKSKITRNMLSTGTERFLNLIRYTIETIDRNGILIIDEVEQNMHKELVELIIKLFSEMRNKNAQIIFTTLSPEIFDIKDNNNRKLFKQDMVFVIDNVDYYMQIKKLMNIEIDGKRVKGDALVGNLYRNRKISCHPNIEQIEKFVKKLKNI